MENDNSSVQRAVRDLINSQAYIGNLLQEMSIKRTKQIPTAAIYFDKKTMGFNILINEDQFDKWTPKERVGVLLHELLHFTNGHIFRFEKMGTEKEHKMKNVAADMSINQYIEVLPEGCVNIADWKMQDGTLFPKFRTAEIYFELLKQTTNDPKQESDDDKESDKEGNSSKGQDARTPGDDINYPQWSKYKEFDQHDWEELTDDEKQQILAEAKKIAERAVEKTYSDFSLLPDSIKSFLMDLETRLKSLNYKSMFKYAAKKAMQSPDRVGTWNRPNKRYGKFAQGTTYDKLPNLNVYLDSSGSMSHVEMNQGMTMVNELLGEGQMRKCNIGLWHTELYNFRKYRKGTPLLESDVQSGGTDPLSVLNHIKKTDPNLSIVFTDGYYDNVPFKLHQKVIWVISDGGQVDHPYKNLGLTFKINQLK